MNKDEIKIQAYRDFVDRLKARKRAVKGYDFNGEFWYIALSKNHITSRKRRNYF